MARSKKTAPLRDVIESVMKRADKEGKRHGARAVCAWPEVVGDEISRHTRGFALRANRELVVLVDSAAWANQLSLMSEDLRDRLNAHLGKESVRTLRFTVSRTVVDAVVWEEAAQRTMDHCESDAHEPIPLTDIERDQAAHIAGAIKNTAVREVALRAMIKDLEQKKDTQSAQPKTRPREGRS